MRNLRARGFGKRKTAKPQDGRQFDRLTATELFCPKCGRSMPVRERLLLVLPEGDKYEYLCVRCGTSVGDRIEKGPTQPLLIV
jgi:DNA-directed RNA polymerase subunit RPC12/RpoP